MQRRSARSATRRRRLRMSPPRSLFASWFFAIFLLLVRRVSHTPASTSQRACAAASFTDPRVRGSNHFESRAHPGRARESADFDAQETRAKRNLSGGESRIRTYEGVSQRVYSPPLLTA